MSRWLIPAGTVLLGCLIPLVGLIWDIQWHTDVGPDTFFTLPHLLIYVGPAIVGITSLIMVLRRTAAQRAGREVSTELGGRALPVFGGTFQAPLGYLIAGCTSAAFLLYGLWDLWWHTTYGFDAVIDSPPHVGLLLCGDVNFLGAMFVFAAARPRPLASAGIAVSLAGGFTWACTFSAVPPRAFGPVNGPAALMVLMAVFTLVMAARVIRLPLGGALAAGALISLIQLAATPFALWSARSYAAMVELPMREYRGATAQVPTMMPNWILLAALGLEVVFFVARRQRVSPRLAVPIAGGIAGGILGGTYFSQFWYASGNVVATIIAGVLLGAAAAWVTWVLAALTDGHSAHPTARKAPATSTAAVLQGGVA